MNKIKFGYQTLSVVTLGCDAVYSGKTIPTYRRNVLPISTGSKLKPKSDHQNSSRKQKELDLCFLLYCFF
jgi:hypothetical protein